MPGTNKIKSCVGESASQASRFLMCNTQIRPSVVAVGVRLDEEMYMKTKMCQRCTFQNRSKSHSNAAIWIFTDV